MTNSEISSTDVVTTTQPAGCWLHPSRPTALLTARPRSPWPTRLYRQRSHPVAVAEGRKLLMGIRCECGNARLLLKRRPPPLNARPYRRPIKSRRNSGRRKRQQLHDADEANTSGGDDPARTSKWTTGTDDPTGSVQPLHSALTSAFWGQGDIRRLCSWPRTASASQTPITNLTGSPGPISEDRLHRYGSRSESGRRSSWPPSAQQH